jgi:hypothetical protein
MNGGGGEGCARGAVSQVLSKWVTVETRGLDSKPLQFAVATMTGGAVSAISGGKFATGAQTAAFGYLFNEVAAAMKGEMQHTQRYHEYTLDNKICDYSQSGCSLANLKNDFGALSWPGSNVTEPSKTGDIRFARYGILLGGFVTQEVFDDGTMVVNKTTKIHLLDPGSISRKLYAGYDGIYVSTIGQGWGKFPTLNVDLGKAMFNDLDWKLRQRFCVKYASC